jgi:hypothetical protein
MLFTFQTKLFTSSKVKSEKVRVCSQNSGTFFVIHTTIHPKMLLLQNNTTTSISISKLSIQNNVLREEKNTGLSRNRTRDHVHFQEAKLLSMNTRRTYYTTKPKGRSCIKFVLSEYILLSDARSDEMSGTWLCLAKESSRAYLDN